MGETSTRILIVCGYPPPYEGMPIYAERLSSYLEERGFDCKVIDIGRKKGVGKGAHVLVPLGGRLLKYFSAMWLAFRYPADIVYINCSFNGNFWGGLAVCAFCRILHRRTVLGIHGGASAKSVYAFGVVRRTIAKVGLSLPIYLVCVNSKLRDAVVSLGRSEERISVTPAFCPYWLLDRKSNQVLPRVIVGFCESRKPMLVSGIAFERKHDWRTLISAFARLKRRFDKAGLMILGRGEELGRCSEMAESEGLSDDILLTGDLPHSLALTVYERFADVMIRPTFVDGDSCFVREGLALLKPVVASDTDFRPDGVVLFRKGNPQHLASKVEFALQHKERIVEALRKIIHPDYFRKTKDLFGSLLPVRQDGRSSGDGR